MGVRRFLGAIAAVSLSAASVGATVPAVSAAAAMSPAANPPATQRCTYRRDGHSPNSEWASCLGVSAALSRLPGLGEEATLRVVVRAQVPRAGTEVQLDVPDSLMLVDAAGAGVLPNAGDFQIGGRVQAALANNATSSGTYSVTVPNNVPADNYFLIVCNDVAHVVAEASESNNCRTSTTTVAVWSGQTVFHTNIDNSFVPVWTAAAAHFGVTLADLPRTGAAGLVFLMGANPAATPFTPPPANNGPYVITTTYDLPQDAALVERYATALSLTDDQFLYLGAYFLSYLYVLGA